MKEEKSRRLAAIMFTDIVGYTALMQKDESAAAQIRKYHREIFQDSHQTYNGDILQYFGDGTLSVFQSAVEAVECAIAIQTELNGKKSIPLRIGLHLGDIVFDGTEVYGDGVNLTSRIESMGVAGAILLSGALNEEIKNQPHISTQSLGRFSLKNIEKPVEVFTVINKGLNIPARSELKGKQGKQTKSIAVLPFINMSSDKDNEYFSDGMTEEIINALTKIQGLKVTSRTSSFYFKDKSIPIRQIGKELNVSTILEGSIRLAGNKMRITAQLVDVQDDFHFWAETFDRFIDDIFAVQDEISLLIADKLREHVGHFEIEDQLVDSPDIPVETYKAYLKSRYHILKMSKPEIMKGISILEDIIKEQPHFALAHLGMHLAYTLLGTIGLVPASEAFTQGQPYLEKAIQLDENLPEVQLNLSYMAFLQSWDLNKTYKHLNKAFETRPTVEYYQSMASTLVAEGKFEAAINYIDTAIQLDPFSAINYHLKGFIFYTKEKFNKAIEYFKKSISLESHFMASTLYMGQALVLSGRKEEGLALFENLPDDEPGDLLKTGGITLAHACLGNKEETERGIELLEAHLESELMDRALNLLIFIQTMRGNHELSIQLLEKGVKLRLPMMVYQYVEPILKPLRSNPRFQELMQKVLGKVTPFDFSNRKYKKALFDTTLLEEYKVRLETLMDKDKPYLDPSLTLRDLAKMMEIPPNHLSQLLNEGFEKNFSEYINSNRVEAFKNKVADPSQQQLTILALAYESGFNSKTVFNTFFKKATGKTPKEYWKEIVK